MLFVTTVWSGLLPHRSSQPPVFVGFHILNEETWLLFFSWQQSCLSVLYVKELYQQECWPFFCIGIRHSTHFLSCYPPSLVRLLYTLLIHLGCLHCLHPMQRLLDLVNIFISIYIFVLYISVSQASIITICRTSAQEKMFNISPI